MLFIFFLSKIVDDMIVNNFICETLHSRRISMENPNRLHEKLLEHQRITV